MEGFASFFRTGMGLGISLDPSAQGLNTSALFGIMIMTECPGSYAKEFIRPFGQATSPHSLHGNPLWDTDVHDFPETPIEMAWLEVSTLHVKAGRLGREMGKGVCFLKTMRMFTKGIASKF